LDLNLCLTEGSSLSSAPTSGVKTTSNSRPKGAASSLRHEQHRVANKTFVGATADIERNNNSKGSEYTLLSHLKRAAALALQGSLLLRHNELVRIYWRF